MGILSQGLRIAPPEAPHHGYAYGKGLYFANCFTTSACYCSGPDNTRCILLNKVALGKVGQYKGGYTPNSYLTKGCDSCIGFACKHFDSKAYEDLDGIKVPKHSADEGGNAYIVYNLNQSVIKYIIRFTC